MGEIPEDLRAVYEATKQGRYNVGTWSDLLVRKLIERVSGLEAENGRLKAPVSEKDVDSLFMILTSLHEDVEPPTRHDIRIAIDAMLSARAQEQAMKPPVIYVVTPESSSGKLWAEVQRLQAAEAESARTIAHLNQTHREVSEMQQARIAEMEKALTYIASFSETVRNLGTAGMKPEAL